VEPYRQPVARLRAGVARREITPPVGIFSRCWGAALHEAAEGVHRPFFATALALEPLDQASAKPQVILSIDLGWLEPPETEEMLARFRAAGALEGAQLLTLLSHTHAGANLSMGVSDRPGAELIRPYFDQMVDTASEAVREALGRTEPVWMSFGAGGCDLAVNRDLWDEEFGEYVCGFNPDGTADDTVMVGRVSRDDGSVLATLVNYSCHPTSLGPGNRLLSPDYIGAMREIVESSVGGLCLFALGASAETTPRESYSAEVAVADRNGRQLGFAAASALLSLLPPGKEMAYSGPVISGATLGAWECRDVSGGALKSAETLRSVTLPLEVPLKPIESPEALQQRYEGARQALEEAQAEGDAIPIRNATAMLERARRQLARKPHLPTGGVLPYDLWLWQIGDAFLVGVRGEPHSLLQTELRRRFPDRPIFVAALTNGTIAYLLPRDRYGIGLYQDWVSSTGPGGLEMILEAATRQIEVWS